MLKYKGYKSIVAGTVKEGIKRLDENPQWVVLDLMLPDGCGTEILKYIRNNNLPISVVIVSGCGDDQKIAEVMALGPNAYIKKPLNLNTLLCIIEGV